jgi:hypothetical protein
MILSPIDYAGEGRSDGRLAQKLIEAAGGIAGVDYTARKSPPGKHALDKAIGGLMAAARHGRRVLVLRDLDADEPCAGALVSRLAANAPDGFCLRIAVRAAEAWLLADRDALAKRLRVPLSRLPDAPELLDNPKQTLREIGAQSRDRAVRASFCGTWQQTQGWVADFVMDGWEPSRAAPSAPSLARALKRIEELADLRQPSARPST